MSEVSSQREHVTRKLEVIEVELRRIEYWDVEPPAPEALQSTQPFCVDTLTFPQWLQFVFLPGMQQLLDNERPLPQVSGIAPMAEEFFRPEPVSGDSLIEELHHLDRLLNSKQ